MSPTLRLAVTALIMLGALPGCGGTEKTARAPGDGGDVTFLVPREPERVARVVVAAAEGTKVEVRRAGPTWKSAPGTDAVAATLMLEGERGMLPLGAYRRFSADLSDPQFGLIAPEIEVDVEDGDGKTWKLLFGASNFNGAGYYVTTPDNTHVYLVPRRTRDNFVSLVRGLRIDTPRPTRETEILSRLDDLTEPDDVTSPWLRQALAATVPVDPGPTE